MAEVELIDSDDAEVDIGDEVVIRLRENGTTGYVWSVRELGAGLELISNEFVPPSVQQVAGAAGERLVRVRVVDAVSASVVLEHARPWEAAPIEQRRVRVTVRGQPA
ncbi:MAG TPA: protease inhibitor I42 family protein [Actinophytocola sp.]|uniref:protease inhibitor I42 family protein n=1 Tax=Actinophytocola sp. TaxID=1872138 RepID=UPI002F941FDD